MGPMLLEKLIMFLSYVKKEEAYYSVNASWIVDLPWVAGQFGHDEEQIFPSSATINEKGRMDIGEFSSIVSKCCILMQIMFWESKCW